MNELTIRTRNTILILGLLQGMTLLGAHSAISRDVLRVPDDLLWLLPWWAVGFGAFSALQLIVVDARDRRLGTFALVLAAVLALTAAYAAYTVEPSLSGRTAPTVTTYVFTAFIGWYVLLPFVQAYLTTGRWPPAYALLYEFAWNNGITLLIASFFTGVFWGLLALWAGLFNLIGIGWLAGLFFNRYFAYPVTALVFAFAVYLGRSHASAVVTVRRVILAVFKALLPLLALITVLFLATLPVMGLEPLWATRHATALLLTLQIAFLLFINAVFQDGQGERPYAAPLRVLVQTATALLPVYSALCAYALSLRIAQYGWSPDRFWAVLLAAVVALYALSYAIAALRRGTTWMAGMAPANVAIAAVLVALFVAVNSPLLDAKRISVESQVARLLAGRVSAANFDYKHLRFDLGRAGNAALADLRDLPAHANAADAAAIRTAAAAALNLTDRYKAQVQPQLTPAQAAPHFTVYPRSAILSETFLQYALGSDAHWQLKHCLRATARCLVLAVDMNGDSARDYVVFRVGDAGDRMSTVFAETDGAWQYVGSLTLNFPQPPKAEDIEALLAKSDYALTENPWRNLKLGEYPQQFRLK